ncbi:uncharacterized protein BCR38DRAFT_385787 [Pseudomassariella vexata]|uniref:DUF7708 domain-containing protein n=1 Tax=Pseudomassariella vexata TaxID=1141098 RepID=A0A1Y2EAH9_9PEZI|nr:uncharacterized protein BCR38DRAFT_385787 [Pseudomassariella vexata]ORY68314.1 hypothetical protein BCR38DRAFT_385787 [Pseudomassariella vexata]
MASQQIQDTPQRQPTHPEVSEFMVKRLDGKTVSALNATSSSGVVFNGLIDEWVPERDDDNEHNFNEIYSRCVEAQNSLITTANKFCKKRKLPSIGHANINSWDEVEESVLNACNALEKLSERDKNVPKGLTGRMRSAFRTLCQHSGAGMTLLNLVPTDSYCSVLCGGLKVIFTGLQQTGTYRQEIYKALEELPLVLNDHAAMIDLNKKDEQLHRRAAVLYTSLFRLMELILAWFLKNPLATVAKITVNPSGFSDRLKDRIAEVKLATQHFGSHTAIISAKSQRQILQQNHSIMYMQGQSMHMSQQIMGGIEEINSRLLVLERLKPFLECQQDALEDRRRHVLRQKSKPKLISPAPDVSDILKRYLYDPELIPTDCENVLKIPLRAGHDIEEDRVVAIQNHPRFNAWLALNESSLLFINANSDPTSNLEMSVVSAKTFQRAIDVSNEQKGSATELIPLAFFCSQHRDYRKDENGHPAELAMSMLLQLLDSHRDFDSEDLEVVMDELNPQDITSICAMFGFFLAKLPSNAIVILIVDGLRFFAQPADRRKRMGEVVEHLVEIYRQQSAATLKFLFANSTEADFVEHLLSDDEVLRIPRDLIRVGGYSTWMWKRPVAMKRPEHGGEGGSESD